MIILMDSKCTNEVNFTDGWFVKFDLVTVNVATMPCFDTIRYKVVAIDLSRTAGAWSVNTYPSK